MWSKAPCISLHPSITLFSTPNQWQGETQEFCPNAKVVLVGCKLDMRTDLATLRELSKQRLIPVTHEQVRPLHLQLNSHLDFTPMPGFFGP